MQIGFQHGGRWWLSAIPTWQDLAGSFSPVPSVQIPAGSYDFTRWETSYEHDPSANFSGSVLANWGRFYDGHLFTTKLRTKVALSSHVVAFAGWERNDFQGVGGSDRTTHLVGPELRLAASPRVELSGIWQYNTAVEASNVNLRLSWEFRPLSFLYVVYNDNASLDGSLRPFPTQRQLIVKATWLWQP